jgi:hypothetical protein
MKIAYLILAHNTPRHMQRLIGALDSPNATFVVHVDAKSDIAAFRVSDLRANVRYLADRVPVYWGEFSMVAATFRLIEEGLKQSPDYLCLISGSDYPLRAPSYIEDFFARHHGREFMNLVAVPSDTVDKPIGRVADYCLQTPFNARVVNRVVRRINAATARIGITRDYSKTLKELVPYAGSSWWALTAAACRHILSFVAERPDIVRFMQNVPNPDESFFQVVIGNSRFAGAVTRNLTFTDWSRPGCAPAIIDMEHVHSFMQCDRLVADDAYGCGELLFARKFTDDSAPVTDFIDANLANRGLTCHDA